MVPPEGIIIILIHIVFIIFIFLILKNCVTLLVTICVTFFEKKARKKLNKIFKFNKINML